MRIIKAFNEDLKGRKLFLEKLIVDIERSLLKAPEGKLRFSRRGKNVYYYCRMHSSDTTGQYIFKKDIASAAALAQKDYNEKVLATAKKELAMIDSLLEYQDFTKLEDIYDSLEEPRRVLIAPVAISDREYAEEWASKEYVPKDFKEGSPEFYTDKGKRVRSKSEILIADALDRLGVPYRYECPITLKGLGIIHPDFTVLNVKKRKEYYWEHLGMADDQEYMGNAFKRISKYEENGYFLGDNLIITYETNLYPLNTKLLNQKIQKYFL